MLDSVLEVGRRGKSNMEEVDELDPFLTSLEMIDILILGFLDHRRMFPESG